MDKQFQARWRQAEAEPQDVRKSNRPSQYNFKKVNWRHNALWRSQNLEQLAVCTAHEREVELRELQDLSAAQPQLFKAQRKN